MNSFFRQDKIVVGLLLGLVPLALMTLIIWAVLYFLGLPVVDSMKYFAIGFIPSLLILRHYMKERQQLKVVKTLITVFFLTFVAYMWMLMKLGVVNA